MDFRNSFKLLRKCHVLKGSGHAPFALLSLIKCTKLKPSNEIFLQKPYLVTNSNDFHIHKNWDQLKVDDICQTLHSQVLPEIHVLR